MAGLLPLTFIPSGAAVTIFALAGLPVARISAVLLVLPREELAHHARLLRVLVGEGRGDGLHLLGGQMLLQQAQGLRIQDAGRRGVSLSRGLAWPGALAVSPLLPRAIFLWFFGS